MNDNDLKRLENIKNLVFPTYRKPSAVTTPRVKEVQVTEEDEESPSTKRRFSMTASPNP